MQIVVAFKWSYPVADLEGVRVVRLNPPLEPNYFNFIGKFMKKIDKMLKTNPS